MCEIALYERDFKTNQLFAIDLLMTFINLQSASQLHYFIQYLVKYFLCSYQLHFFIIAMIYNLTWCLHNHMQITFYYNILFIT